MGDDRIHTEQLNIGDAFGQVLEECHAVDGAAGVVHEVVERSDGNLMASDAARYFAEPGDWSSTSRFACDRAVGRVLDIGAGAGRAAVHIQGRGHPVVALDPSPGAVTVCRSRGIQTTFTGSVFELAATTPERFDTLLLLGNNLGLVAGAEQAPRFLAALAAMAQPGARIIGETTDPYRTRNPVHLDYHDQNRRLGRLPGQLRLASAITVWRHRGGTTCSVPQKNSTRSSVRRRGHWSRPTWPTTPIHTARGPGRQPNGLQSLRSDPDLGPAIGGLLAVTV
jgi:SAM-dependent methyltransferase